MTKQTNEEMARDYAKFLIEMKPDMTDAEKIEYIVRIAMYSYVGGFNQANSIRDNEQLKKLKESFITN